MNFQNKLYLISFILLFISCSTENNQEGKRKSNGNSGDVLTSDKIPSKSGVIDYDLKLPGGIIPKGGSVGIYRNALLAANLESGYFNFLEFQLDGQFGITFHQELNKFRCGILAKDILIGGYLFKKGTVIELDKSGSPNYLGLGIEGFDKQDWFDVEKIYKRVPRNIDVDHDGLSDNIDNLFFNCSFRRIVVKEEMHFFGEIWLPLTVIEFTNRYPDGLIHPKKIYAQKGQSFRGDILQNNASISFCWNQNRNDVEILSLTPKSYYDFQTEEAGSISCN